MGDPTGRISHLPDFHRGVSWKQPVRCATTANVTIATALNAGDAIDGITLAAGDRVLVKDQTAGAENGIYVAGASPARAFDMDQDTTDATAQAEEVLGAFVYAIEGTTNGGTLWRATNTSAPALGTTALAFIAWTPADAHIADTSDAHDASAISVLDAGGYFTGSDVEAVAQELGALRGADYLVGTAHAGLSAEIVVGTTPGGELGGTWASPTVDAVHSGSAHHAQSHNHSAAGDGTALVPATFTVPGGGKLSAGSAFPGSPTSGDRCWRTDHGMEFYFDGTQWLSTVLFAQMLIGPVAEITATAANVRRALVPFSAVTLFGIYIVDSQCSFYVNGGTALSASHSWVGAIKRNTGASLATITINSGASSAWRSDRQVLGAAYATGVFEHSVTWTKTGTPGGLSATELITYRIIAT